jgi:hypothetical protein
VIDGGGCIGGDGILLGMDLVILDTVDADWLESSQADVQGDLDGFDMALADAVEDFRSEMKSGGGGSYRSGLLGVDGLVAFAIAGRIGARDIGRERDVADAIEDGEEVVGALRSRLKADAARAEFPTGEDLGLQFDLILRAEEQAFANADLAAGTDEAFPIVGISGELAGQQNLNATVEEIPGCRILRADRLSADAFAAAIEAGRKNASVIENQHIAGPQQVRKLEEEAISMAAGSLEVKHAGAVAGGEGLLGNQVFGETEVEVGNQHGGQIIGGNKWNIRPDQGRLMGPAVA